MEKIYAMNEIAAIIRPILQNYGVSRAYLFGSYARGEATEHSDIDLRIDGVESDPCLVWELFTMN